MNQHFATRNQSQLRHRWLAVFLACVIPTFSTLISSAQTCVTPPANLISWWLAEGDANDSLNLNHGVAQGGLGFAPGKVGQAFSFNGTNADVRIPASTNLDVGTGDGLTIEAWINPADISINRPLVEWNQSSQVGVHLWISQATPFGNGPGSIYANFIDDGGNDHPIASPADLVTSNVFQHVAATYDKASGFGRLYYNGTLVAEQSLGSFNPRTSYPLYLGARPTGAPIVYFSGLMDEIDLFNRALSDAEIQAIYAADVSGKCPVPPSVITQPQDQTVPAGSDVLFLCAAIGSVPVNYQWRFNGTNIAGATASSLLLGNIQLGDGGNYSVTVTNAAGSATSSDAVLTVLPPPPCTAPPAGLAAWWQAQGNFIDAMSGSLGTPHNGVSFAVGKVRQAFAFDGGTGYVSISPGSTPNLSTNGGLTIECWINPADISVNHPLIEYNNGSAVGVHLWISQAPPYGNGPGSIYANFLDNLGNNHTMASPADLVTSNAFQHVAATYDKASGYGRLYYNGTLVAELALGSFTPQTTYPLYLGARPSGGPIVYFSGLMDEIACYNRALSPAEIQAVFAADVSGKCALPPSVLSQPTNQQAVLGNVAPFAATAAGSQPLSYQWRLNGTNLAGATNLSLTLNNLQLTDAGTYSLVASNSAGSASSSNALLTVLVPACRSYPIGMVSWWTAESDALDRADTNHGTLQGGLSFSAGKVGQAFNFNGTNANLLVPASASLNAGTNNGISMDLWINPADLQERPLAEWNSSGFQTMFWMSRPAASGVGGPGSLYIDLKQANQADHLVITPPGIINSNTFQHVAFTYDKGSGKASIYVNGVLVRQQTVGTFIPNTTGNLYLGLRPAGTGAGTRFKGQMDEIDLFNRALTAAEVQAIYNTSLAGKCAAPAFLAQPQGLTVNPGTNVTFFTTASGYHPVSYQWRLNGSNLSGATNSSLALSNVLSVNAGTYSVTISNAYGSVTSSNAVLKVNVVFVFGNGQLLTNAQAIFGGSATIQLQNIYTNGYLFYTLDGTTPSFASTQYTAPFVVTQSSILRVLAYSPDFVQSGQSDPLALLILPNYTLTAITAGGGTLALNSTNGAYISNSVATVTATPAAGWKFLQWLGDAGGTNPVTSVPMGRNKSVQAVFGTTFSATAAGGGSVVLNPSGGVYPYGTTIQLSAVPQAGNFFVFWGNAASGNLNPLSFVLTNASPSVSSLFSSLSGGQVALAVVPTGHGQVSLNPRANAYSVGQAVTVTATPDAGQSFLGWSGDASGAQNPLSVSMTQSRIIFANFSKHNNLTFRVGPGGLTDGLELNLNGEFGTAYRLEGSTNLVDWTSLLVLTNSVGAVHYIDYGTTNFNRRFYRGVVLP
jgi:hypothetical protein